MSTTRSQKIKNNQQKNNQQSTSEGVSDEFVSPIVVDSSCPLDKDVSVAGPSKPTSPRIEGSFLERLRAS